MVTTLVGYRELIDNCLQNFLALSSSEHDAYIFYLLNSLANQEGVAIEYSGVYLDTDPDNTLDDLQNRTGITFSLSIWSVVVHLSSRRASGRTIHQWLYALRKVC